MRGLSSKRRMKTRYLVGASRIGIISLLIIGFLLISAGPINGGENEQTVKIIVPAGENGLVSRSVLSPGNLVARRGSYDVYRVSESRAAVLSSNPSIQSRPDFDLIMLHRQTINTRAGVPDPPELANQDRLAQPGRGLKLIQFAATPVEADLGLLTEAGARIVQYIPENAYLIWAGPEEWKNLKEIAVRYPIIQFLDDYYPAYSVSPRLDSSLKKTRPVEVSIQFYTYGPGAGAAAKTLAADSLRIITPPREALNGLYINLRLSVPGTSLAKIAGLPGVVWINPYTTPQLCGERQDQIMAGDISGAAPSGPGYLGWLSTLSFPTSPSEYPIVDVVDDGFDNGNAVSPAAGEVEPGYGVIDHDIIDKAPPGGASVINPVIVANDGIVGNHRGGGGRLDLNACIPVFHDDVIGYIRIVPCRHINALNIITGNIIPDDFRIIIGA